MTKEEPPKPKRGRRSKAEIQQEFELLVKESSESKPYVNPKEEEMIRFWTS